MSTLTENIYLIGSFFGILISLILLFQIFRKNKANFFIGLVVFIMAIELLFSWSVRSGYANSPNAIPFWKLLNYLFIPPGIWIFVQFNTNDNFSLKSKYYLLFLPAIFAYVFEFIQSYFQIPVVNKSLWLWFTDYLPLIITSLVLIDFWIRYYKAKPLNFKNLNKSLKLSQIRLLLLMISLSMICIMWYVLSFSNGKYFEFVEFILLFMFFGFTILNFMETQNFTPLSIEEKVKKFPHYDDQVSLNILKNIMINEQPFLQSSFPLQDLAKLSGLPPRYVSYLINHHLKKNYKEFINDYRINYFLEKVKTEEINSKTLLGLALDSGFSSKSTFNLVFKNTTGKSPSEYINALKKES